MNVIARNIANLTDARYFAARAVDYLAFNMDEEADAYLEPSYMLAMREWVEGPAITGEFGDQANLETVNETVRFLGLQAVIIPATVRPMQVTADQVIVRLRWTPDGPPVVSGPDEGITAYLLDFETIPSNWLPVADWSKQYLHRPLFVQFDGSISELNALLDVVKPYGIGLTGGEEEAVGVKSFDEIEAIFDSL